MTWLIVLGVFVAEAILMLRTYAIYERKRWVLIFLCVVLGSVLIPALIVVQLEMDSLHYGYPPDGIYKGCYLTDPTSAIIFIAYILVVLSETIIVSLTLVKAVQHLRRSSVPLVVNLYRNGILFYLYILGKTFATR
ncbi:hypothetical protein EW026_g5797 [Hermanssonia centrifuga]|uniref:Uncharacterized protein n=1 Tax=Hermanssonia centrifuga TaxID=98765 RepID=A0A4S4KCZ0_9APHY|nr:hypothetical protein EW026_g5797 [Hermanssonia centrifuga]